MKLPYGVSYSPRQQRLVARDEVALIRIDTSASYPGNAEYEIKDRSFEQAIAPYLHGDWEDFDRLFRLSPQRAIYGGESPVIYSGAEHCGSPKFPNITVVPNLSIKESRGLARAFRVFGCTMGHYHPDDPDAPTGSRIQEVYEFQSYGMLVLARGRGQVELWVARDGDKVAVPSSCHMNLYNLGDEDNPLVTLDFADPERNPANKELIGKFGPILLGYYDDFEVFFRLNRLYVNNADHVAGVHFASPPETEQDRQVRIERGARLELGSLLYQELTQNPEIVSRFARLGLLIQRASPEAVLEPAPPPEGSRLYFSLPLADVPVKRGSEVYRYFFPSMERAEPGPPPRGAKSIAETQSRISEEKKRLVQLAPPELVVEIVVEGAGDWVERAYRSLFRKKIDEGKALSVFYADDTRWKELPEWAVPGNPKFDLQEWETYLDKANSSHFAIYEKLRPDAVFIVTPDFTHSAIARHWVGKTPLVFVEKPFDSHIDNVNGLIQELGRRQPLRTAVLGLDHYQFYALPLHELMPDVVDHLGDALAKVVFYMTESQAIEKHRARSLRYGLTLDLLPHLHALLTYFGDVGTIDEIRIVEAGQYRPLVVKDWERNLEVPVAEEFHNETHSRATFTFEDYSGNDFRIPCLGVVGKGLSEEVKYLEIAGRRGNAVRLDLNRKREPDPVPGYPWDSLFFLQGNQNPPPGLKIREVSDPYDRKRTLAILDDPSDPGRFRRPLERARYEKLVDDLLTGGSTAVTSTLLLTDAWQIVRALDRNWWAIQDARQQWRDHELRKLNPI